LAEVVNCAMRVGDQIEDIESESEVEAPAKRPGEARLCSVSGNEIEIWNVPELCAQIVNCTRRGIQQSHVSNLVSKPKGGEPAAWSDLQHVEIRSPIEVLVKHFIADWKIMERGSAYIRPR